VASPETCWGRRLWGMTPLVPLGLYSGGVAIGYVLPVLWMTSCLYTMARRNGRRHSERKRTSWQLSATMVLPCAVSGLRTGLLLLRPAVRGSGVLRRACLSVCLSLRVHISKTGRPTFTESPAHVASGITLRTSDFVDDVMMLPIILIIKIKSI